MWRAQIRRAARILATSSKKSLWTSQKKRQSRSKVVHGQPSFDATLDVLKAVRQGKRELLHGGSASLANVITRNRYRIPMRRVFAAPLEHVDNDLECGFGRVHPSMLCHVLLENVVLHRAADLRNIDALFFGGCHVEAKQQRRRSVDRHRGRDLIERDPVEQHLHISE